MCRYCWVRRWVRREYGACSVALIYLPESWRPIPNHVRSRCLKVASLIYLVLRQNPSSHHRNHISRGPHHVCHVRRSHISSCHLDSCSKPPWSVRLTTVGHDHRISHPASLCGMCQQLTWQLMWHYVDRHRCHRSQPAPGLSATNASRVVIGQGAPVSLPPGRILCWVDLRPPEISPQTLLNPLFSTV